MSTETKGNLFVAGGKSPNPAGRPKHSVRTVKGMVERFIKRNITPRRLGRIFDELTAPQQAEFLVSLMPYVTPRQSPDAISNEEIDRLHEIIENAIKQKQDHANAV